MSESSEAESTHAFSVLSLRDLVEARDLYHFHLMSKANVVGTAVGLYLIRNDEDWPDSRILDRGGKSRDKKTYPRRFDNSQVRDYSWPCILVLVREWTDETAFGRPGSPRATDIVPKRLYLPDGRAVPVCTVLAPPVAQKESIGRQPVMRPAGIFGAGLPVRVEIQQEPRFATVGCLVSDGHLTYALTARHACGEEGTPVQVGLRSHVEQVGVSSPLQITRKLFSEVYPALPLRQTWLNLDVGLVRLEDLRQWTPNVYQLPPIKPLFDIYEQNLSLRRLMDQPVVAVGAASGVLEGVIKGMFYRYKSVGGFDYVSDFLISPKEGSSGARPGDSGALWQLQMPLPDGSEDKRPMMKRDLRPLAIEWGAQTFVDSKERSTFSLATGLSNVCKLLDVELVVEGSDGVSGTWGALGHYSIGSLAIAQVKDPELKAFLSDNADLISIEVDQLTKEPKGKDLIDAGFVPLADVPDIVWKNYPSPHPNKNGEDIGVVGGRDTRSGGVRSTGPEHANHHCDADRPFDGAPTLTEACVGNPNLITADDWNRYFDTFPETVDVLHRGILPFRVWQYFVHLQKYAGTDPTRFIAAAGTLAHYIGDSSQPLHGSIYSDGIKDEEPDIPRLSSSRKDKQKNKLPAYRGEGVHSAYETDMLNKAAREDQLFPEIAKNLGANHGMQLVPDGQSAAVATLKCMRDVAKVLPPRKIIDAYERSFQPNSLPHAAALWHDLATPTGKVLALGVRTLAMVWESAWVAGGGGVNPGRVDSDAVKTLYEDPSFIESVTVNEIERAIRDA
ncbi:S1/P1 Nuclease [Roseateles sp. NT4]|uniref:S1/P1 Nuclease n=1 Tax=Roseateles sp. NT4 TaxID=3453715 RepID=UPI003EEC806B